MTDELKKFGRYFLLDRLAEGGMAEIFRARLAQPDGGGRIVVIKRIERSFDENSLFLTMFRDEIRVTMGLTHPNIATLYDFGEENGQPYIVMEWVDGKDLRQHLCRLDETERAFPAELAAFIIAEAATGLHYAHTFKDKSTGRALNIVHRDISPQNILISYLGVVKVIDFGIAKATSNLDTTNSDMIKGKPSYLSPEQLAGIPVDQRCDVFSLGTVLWELLTGRKLFSGANDIATIRQIEHCEKHIIPPSAVRPDLPKSLDAIVLKALQKNPDNRYSSAEEFQIALTRFAHDIQPDLHTRDIAHFTHDLFWKDIDEDNEAIKKLNYAAEQIIRKDVEPTRSITDGLTPKPALPQPGSTPRSKQTSRHTPSPSRRTPPPPRRATTPHPSTRRQPAPPLPKRKSFLRYLAGPALITVIAAIFVTRGEMPPSAIPWIKQGEKHLNSVGAWLVQMRQKIANTSSIAPAATPVAAIPSLLPSSSPAPLPTPQPHPLASWPAPATVSPKPHATPVPAQSNKLADDFDDDWDDDIPEKSSPSTLPPAIKRTPPPRPTPARPPKPQPTPVARKRQTPPVVVTPAPVKPKPTPAVAAARPAKPLPQAAKLAQRAPFPAAKAPTEFRSDFRLEPLSNGWLPANSRHITLRFSIKGVPISITLVDFIRYTDSMSGTEKDLTNVFQFQKDGSLTAAGSAFFPLVSDTDGKKTISIQALDQQGNVLQGSVTFKLAR